MTFSQNDSIFSISGSQSAPFEITGGSWALSSFPTFWGWATSNAKWFLARNELSDLECRNKDFRIPNLVERVYWKSGTRRALHGYIDAWDLPLVYVCRTKNWLSIQPATNLVKNVGMDDVATHTIQPSKWIEMSITSYTSPQSPLSVNDKLNEWYVNNFYKIRIRHLITTKITWMLDVLIPTRKVRTPLKYRWF